MSVHTLTREMNETELVNTFLMRSNDIIAEIHRRTMGEQSLFPDANPSMLNKFFDLYVDLVKRTEYIGEIQKFNAQTAADVITMLKQGKITIKDALNLMRLVQMEFEMTELSDLSHKLDQVA